MARLEVSLRIKRLVEDEDVDRLGKLKLDELNEWQGGNFRN